jgi:hypothetical protein
MVHVIALIHQIILKTHCRPTSSRSCEVIEHFKKASLAPRPKLPNPRRRKKQKKQLKLLAELLHVVALPPPATNPLEHSHPLDPAPHKAEKHDEQFVHALPR